MPIFRWIKPGQYFLLPGLLVFSIPCLSGEVLNDLPPRIDVDSQYVFFLHGKIVERKGVEDATSKSYGFFEYEKILHTLADNGFTVISEARGDGTKVKRYATKVASQVQALLDGGVPPANITVSGFSKGGKITLVTSSITKNKAVNFVVLAGCIRNTNKFIDKFDLDLKGRVLSIVDYKDDTFSSCEDMFSRSSGGLVHDEIILRDGGGHGVFYTPGEIWIDPMVNWISER